MPNKMADAVALLQSGQVEDARRKLAEVASDEPTNSEVFRWLAIAHARARDFNQAKRAIHTAIEINPANVDFYLTAANIEQDLGNLQAAAHLLQNAIRLNPEFTEGCNNLGIVLTDLGRIDEAISAFREAIRLRPGYARAYANLAAAQLRSFQLGDALVSARRATTLEPNYAHAHLLCGNALVMAGDTPAAEIDLRNALRLKPDFVEASLLLGRILLKLKRADEAERVIQQAIALSPNRAELWNALGEIPAARDDLAAAHAAYARALTLRPNDLSAAARAALLLPNIYQSEAHLAACRIQFAQRIAQLRANAADMAVSLKPERFGDTIPNSFLLAYQAENDRVLQREYADFVRDIAEHVMPSALSELPRSSTQGRRIRVGFCSRFFYLSTAGNYFASWITDLDRRIFEVFLYHSHIVEDDLTRRLRSASDHFTQVEEGFTFLHQKIRADDLDILVYPEIGMDRIVYLLSSLRLAPIQVCAWGHPVTPGHRTIDYFISCAAMEPPDAKEHYNERLLTLPGIGTRYELPQLSPEVAAKTRQDYQLPDDANLYLFPQSLFKVHPANDQLLVSAMINDAKGVLVMFAGQNDHITQKFVSRLMAAFTEKGLSAQGRVKILPGVLHNDYKRINQLCDLMLDTLHWSGGNTSLDALAMGLPIVTLPGEFMRGRQTMAMLKILDVEELIAPSIDAYLAIAKKLATDKEYRLHITQRILANRGLLFDDAEPPRALGHLLERLARTPVDVSAPISSQGR